jgi:hypothetical protein
MDKVFNFNSDLQLLVNDENITLIHEQGKNKISSENLDKISYELHWENKISPGGLYFRLFWIPLLATLFMNWKLSLIVYVYLGILVVIFTFDSMLELNICRSIVNRFFSNIYYYVEIACKTSNNIQFYVSPDELNKVMEVEKYLNDLKKRLLVKNIAKSEKSETLNYHEDLKKLGELFNSGLITQIEFDLKKKQILGL